jgi:hypothetical protein
MTRLAATLVLTLLLPQLASAKRSGPGKVDPVIYEGIRYVAPNDDGRRGYIKAWKVGTNKKLWELTIFTNGIDPDLEEDVQWVFIKALNIQDGRLMVTSERGKTYQVDVNTKAITQPNFAIVAIARSDSRRARRSQKSPNERDARKRV